MEIKAVCLAIPIIISCVHESIKDLIRTVSIMTTDLANNHGSNISNYQSLIVY